MYLLTDSKKELSLTIAAYDYQIIEKKQLIAAYNSYGDDLTKLMKETTTKLIREVETLIEMKVRAITAFGIVSERESISQS